MLPVLSDEGPGQVRYLQAALAPPLTNQSGLLPSYVHTVSVAILLASIGELPSVTEQGIGVSPESQSYGVIHAWLPRIFQYSLVDGGMLARLVHW